jgi:hypothetical protein
MWRRGETVALRDLWFGAVWRAVAGITVEDDGERAVFWIPPGSPAVYPVDADGAEIRIPRPEFGRTTRRTRRGCVVVCDQREPWTLWHFLTDEGALDYWYVNFEAFLGRGPAAYDSVDHKLDLIVRPDGELTWKDEDELAEAASLGLVDEAAVRRDADRAVAEPPWPSGWEELEPDPGWGVPELPPGWDQPPA